MAVGLGAKLSKGQMQEPGSTRGAHPAWGRALFSPTDVFIASSRSSFGAEVSTKTSGRLLVTSTCGTARGR